MEICLEKIKDKINNATATNRNDLYDSHIYWSQKPYNICDILINSFSKKGDIVFDPFLGSGVTLLQSIKKENDRIGIGCEINDAPIFIVNTLLAKYDTKKFKKISEEFIQQLKKLLPYYYTKCPYCGKNAVITSVIFDKPSRNADINIKTINFRCSCTSKSTKLADDNDYKSININEEIKNIKSEFLIPNSKIAVYENQHIDQIFTKRNYLILDKIIGIINHLENYNDLFKYLLMSIIHLAKITDTHSSSQWPLWIPKNNCVEKNIIDLIEKKVIKFEKTIKYLNNNYSNSNSYKLLHKGSQFIDDTDISDESVQLIITDPPYLGQVAYSEYMQLYKPFLNLNFNLDDEIIVSSAPSRNKNEDQYFKDLDNVFSICSKKMKNEGYLCLYFHDSSLEVWDKLINILSKNHFKYLSQAHIRKSNTLKNIISPKKSLNGDCILFFQKDNNIASNPIGSEDILEIEQNIIKQAKYLVKRANCLSTPELYDFGLMEILIHNGWLHPLSKKYKSLVDIFEKHLIWDSIKSKWTL